jgi:hypothetical protein
VLQLIAGYGGYSIKVQIIVLFWFCADTVVTSIVLFWFCTDTVVTSKASNLG